MDIHKLQDLLNEFSRIPKKDIIPPTYLEIAGQPHYENVCSNILQFYFDTKEQHKLKDLLLKSLLSCLEDKYKDYSFDSINIEREYSTDNNNRIDIVVECEDIVVVIENKIFHWVANDLKDYQKCIEEAFKDKDRIFILLSLNKLNKEDLKETKFENITYEQFFQNLKQNLGTYFINANNQYIIFLLDFIKTIENLINPMGNINKEFFDFYIRNQREIEELSQAKINLENDQYNVINQLEKCLKEQGKQIKNHTKIAIWEKNTLYIDFKLPEYQNKIAIDVAFYFDKICCYIFLRGNENPYEILCNLLYIKKTKSKKYEEGYILFEEIINFYDIDIPKLADKILKICEEIKFS